MSAPSDAPPDDELVQLVADLCDETLDESKRLRLEARLREDPGALRYCAERIRFESELNEALSPKRKLEWSETRRLVRDDEDGWELRLEQSLRFGARQRRRFPRLRSFVSRRSFWIGLLALASTIGIITWRKIQTPAPARSPASVQSTTPTLSPLILKNGDFEDPSLERTASPETRAILAWQDYYNSDATLIDIARKSNSKILAHAGRNVVRLEEWDFLTQILTRKDGNTYLAQPNHGIRIKGWAYAEPPAKSVKIEGSLRFVAAPYPEMCQYVTALNVVTIPAGKWTPFTLDLIMPDSLLIGRVTKSDKVPFPEKLDVTGKSLALSIDNRVNSGGALYLDDLKIEEIIPSP